MLKVFDILFSGRKRRGYFYTATKTGVVPKTGNASNNISGEQTRARRLSARETGSFLSPPFEQ
jgi:hypothetical protein